MSELAEPQRSWTTDVHDIFQCLRVDVRSIVRVASRTVGDMRKEEVRMGALTSVGMKDDGGMFEAVALTAANRLCTSSRTW